jgi:hypothetical protein
LLKSSNERAGTVVVDAKGTFAHPAFMLAKHSLIDKVERLDGG